MAGRSTRPRKPPAKKAARPRRAASGGGSWRPLIAMLVLAAGIGAIAYLAWRSHRVAPSATPGPSVEATLREVAARFGCGPDRVTVAEPTGPKGTWELTVHAPRRFQLDRFLLELEAAAHNLGGRLEPAEMAERGGYGLARLDGKIGEQRWRIVVLGEAPPARRPATRPQTAPAERPRLAIVLDDAGNSTAPLAAIAKLPAAVAIAVLPNAQASAEVAQALHSSGREILLHMPMEAEPNAGPGPGPGAVEVGLSADEIGRRVRAALRVVTGARGVNNHMGSRATADTPTMQAVMSALVGEGLFFLDSRTTADTVAETVARERGVPALRRDVFLDVVAEPDAIARALAKAVALARRNGSAVAIGHVHPVTIEVLQHELGSALDGVELVRPSALAGAAH